MTDKTLHLGKRRGKVTTNRRQNVYVDWSFCRHRMNFGTWIVCAAGKECQLNVFFSPFHRAVLPVIECIFGRILFLLIFARANGKSNDWIELYEWQFQINARITSHGEKKVHKKLAENVIPTEAFLVECDWRIVYVRWLAISSAYVPFVSPPHSQTHTHTSIVIVFMAGRMMCFSSNRVIETFKCHTHSNVINVLQWSIHTNGVVVVLANSSFTSAFCVLSSIALAKCLKWVWLTCSDDGGSEQFGTDSISKDSRSIDAIIIPIAINTYWILTRAISRASVFPMHAPNGLHVSVLLTHLKRFSNFGWTKSNNKKASGEMKKAKTFDFIIFLRF